MPKRREVQFSAAAIEDMRAIYDSLAGRAGHAVADRYTDRIYDYVGGFDLFAERGARRDDLRPGMRLIGFERRVTILFEVTASAVVIVSVAYGGQDIEARFAADDPDAG